MISEKEYLLGRKLQKEKQKGKETLFFREKEYR